MKKQYAAEVLGTCILTLVVLLSSISASAFPLATPVLAALTLTMFAYTVGHISGTHLNPAITVGLLVIDKIKFAQAAYYIIAQFIGAFLAVQITRYMGAVVPIASSSNGITASQIVAEGLGAVVFAFGIASVVRGRVPESVQGVVVGGSLLLGIAISALCGALGILNPAVAYGLSSFTPAYIFGPIIGSVVGFGFYQILDTPAKKQK